MNEYEREDARRVGRVIRAARKLRGISQSAISKELQITQATFSNIEKGQVAISGSLWFRLSRILGVSSRHAFLEGIIDNMAHLDDPSEAGIKIPKRYTHHAHSTIRTAQPFLKFLGARCGEQVLEQFMSERLNIDPDVRFIYSLRLSIRFNCDLAAYLIQGGHLKINNLAEMTNSLVSPQTHGKLAGVYEKVQGRRELIKTLLNNISLYEQNFSYSLVDESPEYLDIHSKPAEFMRYFSYKEDQLPNFLNLYRASFLASFSRFQAPNTNPAQVKIIPSNTKRKTECIFRVMI